MSYKHSLLAAAYHPIKLLNSFKPRSGGRLRALIYHGIAPEEQNQFREQLRFLARNWQFVDAKLFGEMMSGDAPITRDSLLVTFDDGFMSCREVAEPVLAELSIKALFFVVSEYVLVEQNWREFVASNIFPDLLPEQVPEHYQNMKITDLEYLLSKGHAIGGHTATHAKLSLLSGESLVAEIIDSGNMLENSLGIKVEHFAYTFGNLVSFSPTALELCRKRYKFIYTGLRGDNSSTLLPWAIARDELKPGNSKYLAGSFLEGGADRLYATDRDKYYSWAN
jgi:peptidoglycan/xylan/chitin deacetylase (PgdA/CDA1 family)